MFKVYQTNPNAAAALEFSLPCHGNNASRWSPETRQNWGLDQAECHPPKYPRQLTKVDIVNPASAADVLFRIVQMCADGFYNRTDLKYYAPYFAVVQSSGMGKSTALFETGKRFRFFLFLLLNTSPDSEKLFPGDSDQLKQARVVAQSFTKQVKRAASCENDLEALEAMMVAIHQVVDSCQETANGGAHEGEMLLVLDEAKTLVEIECQYVPTDMVGKHEPWEKRNAFVLFRKALESYCRNKDPKPRLVVVVVDTVTSVGNFVPPMEKVGAHARRIHGTELFPVVYSPLYFDVHAKEEGSEDQMSLSSQLRFGRPLWKRLGDSEALDVAQKKVMGQDRLKPKQANLALLGCRVPNHIPSSGESSHR